MIHSLNTIPQMLRSKNIILVGEMHGVVENAQFLELLVNTLKADEEIYCVGFEYTASAYRDFEHALAKKDYEMIKDHQSVKMMLLDGRFSRTHFEVLARLYHAGVRILFFDSESGNWDDRDEGMYNNIQEFTKLNTRRLKIILIAGNIHTNLTVLRLDNRLYRPLGAFFDLKDTFLVKLEYHSGEYFNFGRKVFDKKDVSDAFEVIIDNDQAEYHIAQATPTQ